MFQIARGDKTVEEISDDLPINSHCLQLGALRKAHDTQLLGIGKPSLFDQYVSASLQQTPLRNLASTSSYIFCATSSSFATFLLFDSEASNRNALSDTFHHFSSKITSAVP